MGWINKSDVYLAMFEIYEKSRGYKERTVTIWKMTVKVVQRSAHKGAYVTVKDAERHADKIDASSSYRTNLKQSVRRYREFLQWWESEGQDELRAWMREEGYKKKTIKDYLNMLRLVGGRRKATQSELKKLYAALRVFERFTSERFSSF